VRIAIDPTITHLLRDICAGIRVLQSRDGVDLSESQILERARNIVMGLVGNYRIEALDSDEGRNKAGPDHQGQDDGRDGMGRPGRNRDGKSLDVEQVGVAFAEPASMMATG
jgi:hypothetical protein